MLAKPVKRSMEVTPLCGSIIIRKCFKRYFFSYQFNFTLLIVLFFCFFYMVIAVLKTKVPTCRAAPLPKTVTRHLIINLVLVITW